MNNGQRPHDFTPRILSHWQRLIGPLDTVIHLGDVIFKNNSLLGDYLDTLPGYKILVRGNHDRQPVRWYYQKGFHFVCDLFIVENLLFTHKAQEDLRGCKYNFHGHFHGPLDKAVAFEGLNWYFTNIHKYIRIDIDQTLRPRLLSEVVAEHERQYSDVIDKSIQKDIVGVYRKETYPASQ